MSFRGTRCSYSKCLCYNEEVMTNRTSGFTIIEVVLFLAISSLLAVGLMAGSSVAIQRQQYRDAVQSFANFIRDEYAHVVSVENNRSDTASLAGCDDSSRGQSECVIVGRYIATDDGEAYKTYPIYAKSIGEDWQYRFDDSQATAYKVGWGSKASMKGSTAGEASLVIYRNPKTGIIATYSDTKRYDSSIASPSSIDKLINVADSTKMVAREICIDNTGWAHWVSGERQSVMLAAYAASGNAVAVKKTTGVCV